MDLSKKTLVAALLGSGMALTASSALAFHIPAFNFTAQPFTFDATAYGGTSFSAKYIDFSYNAEVDQTCAPGGCTFSETGVAGFGTFRTELGGFPVLNTGLGTQYQMYAVFSGAGTVAVGGGGIIGNFTSFTVNVFIDPDMNTVPSTFQIGAAGGNETKTVSGNGDDVNILTGTLIVGGFHVFPGLAAGDFDVLFDVTSFDSSVWGGEAFSGPDVQGDINGVNTVIQGVAAPPASFVDASITGSGNTSFQSVPEPGSLSLIGLGLLGLGAFLRNRRKRTQHVAA